MANFDALLRISAKVLGTNQVEKLAAAIGGAEKTARGAKATFKGIVDSSLWQGAAAAAAGFGVAIGLSARAAITFEESMADVRKVVQGIDTPQGLRDIKNEILQLSREMPITADGFAQIYAAAGQAGIPRQEIRQFAVDVGRMGVAFDMTAQEAGSAMAKLRSSLGIGQKEVVLLADALNHLSNNTGASAAELTNFTLRTGAVGQSAGLAAERTAAFGAAMIAAGIETEVAATSFNNMVKALTRGDSMTDRQTSALKRLGIDGTGAVVRGERDMTAEVERQGRRRLEAIQDESDRQQSELNRRYRRQLQVLEDQWEDESEAFQEGIDKRQAAEIKALQKQSEWRIKEIEKRHGENKAAADREIELEREATEAKIEAIRDRDDALLKQERRAARDRQAVVRENMEAEQSARLAASQRNADELRQIEQENIKSTVEAAKAAAEDGGASAGAVLAKRMQENALGTIMDIFKRIKGLPKEMQLSVMSDLFGDEARGLAPMIQNIGTLEKAMGLVGDKTQYAGSMLKEYETRSATTANALRLARNNFQALQITIGESVIPAVLQLTKALSPLLIGLGKFAADNPAIVTTAVALGGVVSAVALALPGIASFVFLLGKIWPALSVFAATIAGFITWPAVLAAGLVAAGVAIFVFRDKIGAFLGWWWTTSRDTLNAIGRGMYTLYLEPWVKVTASIRDATMALLTWLPTGWRSFSTFVTGIFTSIGQTFSRVFVQPVTRAFEAIMNTGRNALRSLLQWTVNAVNRVIDLINPVIAGYNSLPAPNIGFIPRQSVPAFAEGGFVTRPTLAMVGDNPGGREYIVPEGKAPGFAQNILAGARGAAAIPSSTGTGGGGPVTVNLTTGPLQQLPDGRGGLPIDDVEKLVREAVIGALRQARTPAGRYAMGF